MESMRINISVKPKARENGISMSKGKVLVSVSEAPEKGKANSAVLKLIRKKLGFEARLVSGASGRDKTVELYGDEGQILRAIGALENKGD
jgi:hypothetical protein